MANKTIKGGFKSYVVDDSKNTYTLAKNAFLHYGGEFDIPSVGDDPDEPVSIDLSIGYGIYEDLTSGSDFKNNIYNIDGKLTGLFGGIATFGDGTKINIGKTADVNAQLGIGIGSISDISDPSALAGLTFGTIFAAGNKAKVTIDKGAEIGGLIGVTVTGKGASVTNSGEMDNALVGMLAGSLNLTGSESLVKASAATTKLTNNGSIEAGVGMVGFTTDDVNLTNGKKGEIEGLVGMIGGALPTGEIDDPSDLGAINMKNSGDIIAAVGMLGIFSLDMTLTNAKGAEIIAGAIGIATMTVSLDGAPEGLESSVHITNAGTIRTTLTFNLDDLPDELGGTLGLAPAAILGYMGDEIVLNTGKIYGDVSLGDGNDKFTMKAGLLEGDTWLGNGDDTFSFAGGQIKGKVYGGDGDDTYFVTKTLPKIVELADQGEDTVKSAVGYKLGDNLDNLVLTGNKDINGIGNDLANELTGNAGNNKLTGGDGADTFFFATKGGKDTITDFVVADDFLDLSGWKGMTAFTDDNTDEKNGNVVIFHGKDTLVIENHTLADLDLTHITFAT